MKPADILRLMRYPLIVLAMCLNNSVLANAAKSLSQSEVAQTVSVNALENRFPSTAKFTLANQAEQTGIVRYTFDADVHAEMAKVYLQYQPDYACFVAIDVDTGAIINLTSFIKGGEQLDNLVMRADYPAASVFKLITAAAAIDSGKLGTDTVIPFNGKSTTLYKGQVLRHKDNKWTRRPTLKESFAKSINPVFGRIGIFDIGGDNLRNYAQRFGFDRPLESDFLLAPSRLGLDLESQWMIAEAASGYTRDITLSPIHAAQLAAIVANDGELVTPYMVDSVTTPSGELLYKPNESKKAESQVISADAAQSLRSLMRETVRIGSARSSFKGLNKYRVYKGLEIGGKTGSLTGFSPQGRHDWFVGYAQKDGRRVAYASLIVNKEKWVVRSAYVARQFIYHYFSKFKT